MSENKLFAIVIAIAIVEISLSLPQSPANTELQDNR